MGNTPSNHHHNEFLSNAGLEMNDVEEKNEPVTRMYASSGYDTDEDNRSSASPTRPTIRPKLKFVNVEKAREGDLLDDRLAYVLDGIEWGGEGNNKVYKRKFPVAFTEAMRSVDINGAEKLLVMERYVRLVDYYQKTTSRWAFFSYGARSVVAVGSILIPVLVAIDDDITERTSFGQALAYTTMAVGFTVSLVNGFQELLQSTKQFITSSNTNRALIAEGWAFVSMSGRYEKYDNHTQCWRRFFDRVQKMDAAAHNVSMSIVRGDEKIGRPGLNQNTGAADDDYSLPIVYSKH